MPKVGEVWRLKVPGHAAQYAGIVGVTGDDLNVVTNGALQLWCQVEHMIQQGWLTKSPSQSG